MTIPAHLSAPVKAARWRLALTFSLLFVECVSQAMAPWLLGVAIDAVLGGSVASGLGIAIGAHVFTAGFGTARRMYDTRVFARLYADMACATIGHQRALGVPSTAVAARAGMVHSLVSFLEDDLASVVVGVMSLAAGLVALGRYEPRLVLPALVVAVPIVAINVGLYRRMGRLNLRQNNRSERAMAVIDGGTTAAVRRHYNCVRHWDVRISDAWALNWLSTEGFVVLLVAGALGLYGTTEGATAGGMYAVLGYAWKYVGALDVLPELASSWANLRDVLRRLSGDASEAEEADGSGEVAVACA